MTADAYLACSKCAAIVHANYCLACCPSCGFRKTMSVIPRGEPGAVTRRTIKRPAT